MSTSVCVPWDEALVAYDFGPDHPLNPLRVDLTMRLAREVMEKAPEPALRFGVPIQVDVRAARNWEEAH